MDVEKVARLARIELNAPEKVLYQQNMDDILRAFENLQHLPTGQVQPLYNLQEDEVSFREDVAEMWQQQKRAMQQAPSTQGSLYRVPPVVS
ncbi:MAG: Asp-tRNA(Asn)/Glu-tRNA(Gln) amidotransferase GatCAB subunit C [Bdellovibrionaceae bacterium]|nr:Asp-tRNA(Asn)/Glu-tRNA(Gln) amidotransferase GatCAB subunit C [Pseudobdellovibrionaceae bacterium]|tara:strand:+ start:308 stop:580 length:273 start_codon:yes stop_codon:yes gene_type:complete